MTAFFQTRTESGADIRTVELYFEDDWVALDAVRESKLIAGRWRDVEVMLDRDQVTQLIAALTTMQTMIAIRHPQPQLEALAVAVAA